MTSPVLFHGPGALREATSVQGDFLGWFGGGEKPLGVADSREALALLDHPNKRGVLILGPLDRASPEAMDALLKTVEEPPAHVELRLFAVEEGLVPATIRSRCLRRFCPQALTVQELGEARQWIEWALTGRVGDLAEKVLASKSEEPLLPTSALAEALRERAGGEEFVTLWKALRALPPEPTRPEVFTALVALKRV